MYIMKIVNVVNCKLAQIKTNGSNMSNYQRQQIAGLEGHFLIGSRIKPFTSQRTKGAVRDIDNDSDDIALPLGCADLKVFVYSGRGTCRRVRRMDTVVVATNKFIWSDKGKPCGLLNRCQC